MSDLAFSAMYLLALLGGCIIMFEAVKLAKRAYDSSREVIKTARTLAAYVTRKPPTEDTGAALALPSANDEAGTYALCETLIKRLPIKAQAPVLSRLDESFKERYARWITSIASRN